MKTIRAATWRGCAGAMLALGLCAWTQAALAAPTQWTALYNRGAPTATYVVGDMLDFQFEFAINTDTTGWGAEYGLGQTQDGSDWSWYSADWSRMDGDVNRVWISKTTEHQFTSAGTWYYAGRFMNGGDTYHVATDWTANSGEPLAAGSYFTVNELEPPSFVSASYSNGQVNLGWTRSNDKDVMILMTIDDGPPMGSPEQGKKYLCYEFIGNQLVVPALDGFGVQSGTDLDVTSLIWTGQKTYHFTFYSVNNSNYYSAGVTAPALDLSPQARNTGGGAPEAPAEIFLGDAGATFGFDSSGTFGGQDSRSFLWSRPADESSFGFFSGWSDFTEAEHKTHLSGVFNSTGTWHWGVGIQFGSEFADEWGFSTDSPEWIDLDREVYNGGSLAVTVLPINDPTVQDVFCDSGSQMWLSWDGNAQNHGVMVVRKLATDSWTEPAQGQFNLYNVGDSLGAGTIVYFDPLSPRLGSTMATGLTAGTTYDFKFYSVNASSTFVIPAPYEGVGFYYSPGVEVQATTLWDVPVVIEGCENVQTVSVDGSPVAVSFAVSARSEIDPNPTVVVDPPSGSLFPVGDTLVAVTAWDDFGHTNTCEFTVTVLPDTTPPVINGCANRSVSAYSTSGVAVVFSGVTASDVVDPNPSLAFDPPSGSLLPLGQTVVAVTAWDAAGNTNTCHFTVTVAIPSVVAWGGNGSGQCNVPAGLTNVVSIEAGYLHSLARRSNGKVTGWGQDSIHQSTGVSAWSNIVAVSAQYHSLGLCSDGKVVAIAERWAEFPDWPEILTDIVAVSAGAGYSRVLRWDGAVTQWPYSDGQWAGVGAVAISAGYSTKITLKYDGTVLDGSGQVVAGLSNVVAIASGHWHNLALRADGTVAAWGNNDHNQSVVPAGLSNVVAIAAGSYHNLALRADGTVVAWGRNSEGQCTLPEGLRNVIDISAGEYHSLARIRAENAGEDAMAPAIYGCENRTIQPGTPAIYMVRVLDAVDPRPTVIYDPPLGTVLPGGDTVVTVTAWDASGNTNTCQFTATVPVPSPIVSQDAVNVREGGEGRFFVRLDRAPEGNVAVSVERVGGASSLSVQSGATRTFKPSNWSAWQVVTLAAPEDENAAGETATFRISAPGAADQFVTATALDDEIGENLALASGGTTIAGTRGYRLADLIDGMHAVSTNYAYTTWTSVPPGRITLDMQAAMTVSRVRILTWDWNYRDHRYTIESSADGANWTMLADASAGAHRGWEDWPVADEQIRYLRFTGLANSANAGVCVPELEVCGARPLPELIQLSKTSVNVREGGEGRIFVRLASAPAANVAVSVARTGGNESLSIQSGTSLTFRPSNWSAWQVVTLAQGPDANADGETATIQVSMPGVQPRTVTATALDDDIGVNLALASSGATLTGKKAYFMPYLIDGVHTVINQYGYTVWTNNPPGTMTLDLGSAAAVSRVRVLNWDWTYRTHRYLVEASGDGRNWSLLADASTGAHHGWEEWAAGGATMRYLRFTGLTNTANTAVCLSELEVYGTRLGRRGPASRGAASIAESEPVSVLTSAGREDETGWNAVDGDENTAWVGQKGGGGYLVVEYAPALELSALEIDVAEGSLMGIETRYSLDAKEWRSLPDDLEMNPVTLNFLWLIFSDDGTQAVPNVLEIRPNP